MTRGLSIVLWMSLAALTEGTAAGPSPGDPNGDPAQSWAGWTWVEHCHVLRSHQLSDFGTYGSLWGAGDTLAILSSPSAGKNATGYAYIATLKQDLWSDAVLITYGEGGTAYTLDHIIGDSLGTNGLAEPTDFYLSRLFLLQNLPAFRGQLIAGRIVLSDFFDTNRVANCETTQFLSDSLVNNPTIPFPEAGMGLAGRLAPTPWLYMQAAVGDASAVATTSDVERTFRGDADFFRIVELGLSPFPQEYRGVYRFMYWHHPAPEPSEHGAGRDNYGLAVSFDQSATRDLTFFFRYGWAKAPVAGLSRFWSVGARLNEPVPGRKKDALEAGLAVGDGAFHDEKLLEVNYHLYLNDHLTVTPLMQIIADPAQNPRDNTFILAGLRAVYAF